MLAQAAVLEVQVEEGQGEPLEQTIRTLPCDKCFDAGIPSGECLADRRLEDPDEPCVAVVAARHRVVAVSMPLRIGERHRIAVQIELVDQPVWKDVFAIEAGLALTSAEDEAIVALADIPDEARRAAEGEASILIEDGPVSGDRHRSYIGVITRLVPVERRTRAAKEVLRSGLRRPT